MVGVYVDHHQVGGPAGYTDSAAGLGRPPGVDARERGRGGVEAVTPAATEDARAVSRIVALLPAGLAGRCRCLLAGRKGMARPAGCRAPSGHVTGLSRARRDWRAGRNL